jgi:hypothetical protein
MSLPHVREPVTRVVVPAGHVLHVALLPPALKVPMGHSLQVIAPGSRPNPGSHVMRISSAWAAGALKNGGKGKLKT